MASLSGEVAQAAPTSAQADVSVKKSEKSKLTPTPISDELSDWIEQNAERLQLVVPTPSHASPRLANAASKTFDADVKSRKAGPQFQPKIQADDPTTAVAVKKLLPQTDAPLSVQVGKTIDQLRFHKECSRFASADGLGDYGEMVVKEIRSGRHSALVEGTDDIGVVCPRYPKMTTYERAHFWVVVAASMSFYESTCTANRRGRGPDGVAYGLMQLHLNHEHLKEASYCSRGDAKTAAGSIRCAFSVLDRQLQSVGKLFSKGTHFGVLRPQGDLITLRHGENAGATVRVKIAQKIAQAIRKTPFCSR